MEKLKNEIILFENQSIKLEVNKLRFNNDSELFALERDRGLEAIIGNIYQSFDGKMYIQQ